MVRKILVTGGMGFIGSNFIRYMLKKYQDIEIINLDKLTYAGNPANLSDIKDRMKFIKGDVCDNGLVNSVMNKVDQVVHFAAETHVDRSIEDAGSFVTTDVYGTFIILESARKHGVSKVIQISTDEVYGEAVGKPSLETDGLFPKSPYAASKAGADRLAYSYFTTHNLPVIITRCSNNYGPYQYPEKLIPLFITNALRNIPLPVYGDGRNTRDWIHVEDHCKAIDMLLESEGFEGETFNIGTGEEKSVLEVSEAILSALDLSNDVLEFVNDRKGHVTRHAVDSTKLSNALGWAPNYHFTQSIKRTVDWYLEHEDWWRDLIKNRNTA